MPKIGRTPKRATSDFPYPRSRVRSKVSDYARHRAALESVRRDLFGVRMSRRLVATAASTRKERFSPVNVGSTLGSANCKQVVSRATQAVLDFTLYRENLCLINKGQTESNRERDIVNLRGFDVTFNLKTLSTVAPSVLVETDLIYCNVAVIAPKQGTDIATGTGNDFFRSLTNLDARALDFNASTSSINLHTLPVNTDLYTVLKHKRFILQPCSLGHEFWHQEHKFYVPLQRQIAYDTDGTCQNPVFLVYWMARSNFTAGATPAQVGNVENKVTTYFREVIV